jgi:acetyl-CoA carboxylase biotin carboxylase subunit
VVRNGYPKTLIISVMPSIKKILIANRGEIACRIIRTCKKTGIYSVAVFSDADKESLFVKQADEAISIGGFHPSESYLVHDKIINAAKTSGADAIHPGYGFLSENSSFAERCEKEGIIFIGPSSSSIEAMGSKANAKEIVQKHNVPVIPGYNGSDQKEEILLKEAKKVGFPLLLKAASGGGGKGMRIVRDEKNLKTAIESAKREALSSFGDDRLIIEKYFDSARHVEFQIFGDVHGNIVHLFERECSIQRRHQKIIEESPSPALSDSLRKKMADAAIAAAKSINYYNAGTVEFIVTGKEEFYFLEVNTRLQVEHPVTEAITGLDLVKLQIEIAEGKKLPLSQEQIKTNGYAIECRLYAEDALNNFLPATGTVLDFNIPLLDGLRCDTGITRGAKIDIFYDPMLAKIICHAENRETAISKMEYALTQMVCTGVTTNREFLRRLLQNSDIIKGNYDTHFLSDKISVNELLANEAWSEYTAVITALIIQHQLREEKRNKLKHLPSGWRNNFYAPQKSVYSCRKNKYEPLYKYRDKKYEITLNENSFYAEFHEREESRIFFSINGKTHKAVFNIKNSDIFIHLFNSGEFKIKEEDVFAISTIEEINGTYKSPMPGEIIKINVQAGDKIKKGDALIILNSMKMENTIEAFEDGIVEEIFVSEKKFVEADTLLIKINN